MTATARNPSRPLTWGRRGRIGTGGAASVGAALMAGASLARAQPVNYVVRAIPIRGATAGPRRQMRTSGGSGVTSPPHATSEGVEEEIVDDGVGDAVRLAGLDVDLAVGTATVIDADHRAIGG